MLNLTSEQIKALTIWANEKLMDILDGADYDGDDWFLVDSSIPELENKIDINLYDWEDDQGKTFIKCAAYEVVRTPSGGLKTICDDWISIF